MPAPSPANAAGGGSPPAKTNAFANFSFTPNKANPPPLSLSTAFAAPAASSSTTATDTTKGDRLKLAFGFSKYLDNYGGEIRKDLRKPMEQFLRTYSMLKGVNREKTSTATTTSMTTASSTASAPAPAPFTFGSTMQASGSAPPLSSSTSTSGLGAPLFPPAKSVPKVDFSFGTAAAPTPGFSFGAPSKAAETTATSSSGTGGTSGFPFSFASNPTTTTSTSAAPPGNDGTDAAEEENTEPSTAGESADVDWDVVETFQIKVLRDNEEGTAKKFAEGQLKLQKHKTSNSCRMIMRSVTGKVMLNIAVNKDMGFLKTEQPRKGKPPLCRVMFKGIQDASKGSETFHLVCPKENVDTLYAKIQELAKSSA